MSPATLQPEQSSTSGILRLRRTTGRPSDGIREGCMVADIWRQRCHHRGVLPTSLFRGLNHTMKWAVFGGDVYSPRIAREPRTTTKMGSVSFAHEHYRYAAYIDLWVVGAKLKSVSPEQELLIEERLQQFNKPAAKSIQVCFDFHCNAHSPFHGNLQSEDGDIIDCVRPDDQHSPCKIYEASSSSTDGLFTQVWQRSGSCPIGTIPIVRVQRHHLLNTPSIQNYGRKPWNGVKKHAVRLSNNETFDLNAENLHAVHFQEEESGKWWLVYGDNSTIGYWPTSLFDTLNDSATTAFFGGDVYSPVIHEKPHPSTGMGSGGYANGHFAYAAYIRLPRVQYGSPQSRYPDPYGILTTQSGCYSAENYAERLWKEPRIYFGGPGRSDPDCP
ncbi:hypothetical protein BHM03_00024436 [Ensete ventricosum]|nr:hypothetical protein BHM03_00024436 [Ensete ventricosum]